MGFSRWRAGGWVVKGRMVFVVWAEGGEGRRHVVVGG